MYSRHDPRGSHAVRAIVFDMIGGRPWTVSHIRHNNLRQHYRQLGKSFHSSHPITDPLRPTCQRLIGEILSRSGLLVETHPREVPFAPLLLRMAAYSDGWLRSPETWIPLEGRSPLQQWRGLLSHLFEAWPVPEAFVSAWSVKGPLLHPERDWYCHLAAGGSLRTAPGMPAQVTARELHTAMSAPLGLGIRRAIHWARVRLLGGGEALLKEALASRMIHHFDMDELWSRLLRKVVTVPAYDPRGLGLIVDTLVSVAGQADGRYAEKLVNLPLRVLHAHCAGFWMTRLVAAEKDGACFSHRDVMAADLRAELRHLSTTDWEPLEGVGGFKTPDSAHHTTNWRWTVTELCNHTQLLAEGRAMRHCVGSYRKACTSGRSAIFSLCRQRMDEEDSQPERCLTLEVRCRSREIFQVRGPGNRLPSVAERHVVERWAAQNGLTLAA